MASLPEIEEKFAIVGVGCRMPPAASSLSAFWRFLMKGGNALKPIKADRWDVRRYFDEDQNRPGKTYAPKGGFLDWDFRLFDPAVFGISPREAASIDPQQRLLLEVVWEAFEDAGLSTDTISGSSTGVFIGAFCIDHLVQQVQPSNLHLLSAHATVGASMTIISNRLSHAFNLRGPSLTLDTACSSSLVAVHYACQSLRLGEADMVIAGGVNVMTRPEYPIMMSKGHFLSDHGECHAFDETASGYARGEGAGVILIKKLGQALADGDTIHAVIRGSGVNQDGHTDGISLPNPSAQIELLASVYEKSGVAPAEVDYVEAHGTGTQAGDQAESFALHTHFSRGRPADRKLLVGSVKTNVGHLEAAAGMAGLLKAIGALKARQVPKNLHFLKPNPKIPFAEYCLKVVGGPADLPAETVKPSLLIGVNSFGYGGTNAHVILESAPAARSASAGEIRTPALVPFSAGNEKALRDLAGKLAFQVGQGFQGTLADVAYTTAFRRSHLEYRAAAVVDDLEQLRELLIGASTGQPNPALVSGVAGGGSGRGPVFVYTGMGPQWWAMGRELMRDEPIVRDTVEEIDAVFQKLSGWSLAAAMQADEASSRMEHTEVAQTANFALQAALTRLWQSWGVEPAAVVGHSVGEVTSAYVAGVYSLEDAVRVSYHRSRLQQTMAGRGGAMLAAGLPEREALRAIAGRGAVSVAAVNSFNAVTLSGDKTELEQVAAALEAQGVFHKFLRVEVAYHSPQMEPLRAELAQSLAGLTPAEPRLPLYSTAYGAEVPGASWDAGYWWVNVRESVRFADAMRELLEAGYASFLEVGPHPVLGASIKECAVHLEKRVTCHLSLRRKEPERRTMLTSLAELYCRGQRVNWPALAPAGGAFIPAPAYPWQRQVHWNEAERTRIERLGVPGPVYLQTPSVGPAVSWEVEINRHYFPFLFEHGVQNQTVFAGMGYVEAALTLGRHIYGKPAVVLENISFEKVLIVDYAKLQFLISEFEPEEGRFKISSRVGGEEGVQRHCRGRLWPQAAPQPRAMDLAKLEAECPREVSQQEFYDRLAVRGLHYGPAFRPATRIAVGEDCFLVKLDGTQAAKVKGHPLHPTIFDAAVQPVLFCAKGERLFVPFSFDRFEYFGAPGAECHAYGRVTVQTDTVIVSDIWLLDAAGRVLAHAKGATCQLIETDFARPTDDLFYDPAWQVAPPAEQPPVDPATVAILARSKDSDMALAAALAAKLPGAEISGGVAASRPRLIVLWGTGAPGETFDEEVVTLLQSAIRGGAECDLTFVTRGARSVAGEPLANLGAHPHGAVALVAQNENDFLTCRSVDLSPADGAEAVLAEIGNSVSGDIAWRHGERFESVLESRGREGEEIFSRCPVEEPVALKMGKGKIDGLHYERAERREPGEGELEIRVHRAGLNYKDLLKVEGRIQPVVLEDTFNGTSFGMEAAGVVLRAGPGSRFHPGDLVSTMLLDGFRSHALVPEVFTTRIPDNLGMEAAGVPVVFLAAYRGLVEIARLQEGERVLIHHATGGVGLAAVTIARWIGAEIYATAGSAEKQDYLRGLGIEHVYSSRDLDFGTRIEGGVDVVIGAQTGQATHVSLGLLRGGGRYIEIGKKDIAEDNSLPLRAFNRNLIFASVDIDRLMRSDAPRIGRTLETIFARLADGSFSPGPVKTVPAAEIREAFREMARSQHLGKVLVDFSAGEVDVLEKPAPKQLVRADGSYIVTGGTSGFGLATGRWLAGKGAGRILLVSRSGPGAPGIREAAREIAALGAKVDVLSVDVTDAAQVSALLDEAGKDFTLRGVFHGAMVLDDAMMADVTPERFRRVFAPKAGGALHLAAALKDRPPLDHLVFYSSVSALVGNRGQTNYVAANSLLDGLARQLRAEGVPAYSINWGALAETGVVARSENVELILSSSGITGLTNEQAFAALEEVLQGDAPQTGVFQVDWEKWHDAHPRLAEDRRFREQRLRSHSAGGGGVADEIRRALGELSREGRLRALEEHLRAVLAATLRTPEENVPLNRKINEMGVDSLMVLELSLGIKERIGVNLSAMEFLKGPTLQQLAEVSETRLWSK